MSRLLAAQRALTVPGWVKDELWRRARATPSLDLRFADSKSLVDATTGLDLVTFSRTSDATFVNSQGVIQAASANTPRFDHNPLTGESLGLLVEEQRTNSIRNNTMVGAVAGTPGTLPTNWVISGLGTLTQEVVGVGAVNGINYIDLRFSGTTSTTQIGLRFEQAAGIAGTNGQTFAFSTWIARVGGSLVNVGDISANANIYTSASAYLASIAFTGIPSQAAGTTLSRVSGAGTIASATAAFIQPQVYIVLTSGTSIDITLRIGMPQLEQGAFATSVIPTSGTAVTRAADVASISGSNFSSWYRQDQGTLFVSASVPQPSNGNRRIAFATDGTGNNRVGILFNSSNNAQTLVSAGGTTTASISSSVTATGFIQSATGYALDDFAFAASGLLAGTDASGAAPSTVDRLSIGSSDGADRIHGHIRRLTFWPVRLPNSTLQEITR